MLFCVFLLGAVQSAVAGAEACGLDAASTPALQAAADLIARLGKEAEAITAVVAATKSKDGMALAQALAECSELELSGPEVDAANKLMEKLGKKVQLEAEVMKAASGFDIPAIEAAVAAAKKGGVADDSQGLRAAEDGIKRIKDQTVVVDDLTKKMDCGLDGLARLEVILSDAREKGIGTHQAELITKAAASVECLTKAQNAKANNSAEAAAAACAMAGEHSLGAAVKEACETVRANIEKLGTVAEALAAALEAKDVDAIKAAYDEAKELGEFFISNYFIYRCAFHRISSEFVSH